MRQDQGGTRTSVACGLFDFDGTLCRGDSVLPYLLYAIRRGKAPRRLLLQSGLAFLWQLFDKGQTIRAKEISLSFIKGRTRQEMDEFARDFFRDVQCAGFFKEGQDEIRRLRREGKKIIVITASADVYMRVLPEFMPVDAVLATCCLIDEQDRYTGKLESNCKGAEKPVRLEAYLKSNGWKLDAKNSCAYGDSSSDAPMLQMAGQKTVVDPGKKLLKLVTDARIVHWHRQRLKESR